jgi:hypothetical protein
MFVLLIVKPLGFVLFHVTLIYKLDQFPCLRLYVRILAPL